MSHLTRLTSPTGLTIVIIALIALIGGSATAFRYWSHDHPEERMPHQYGNSGSLLRNSQVSTENLTGASGSSDWLQPLAELIARDTDKQYTRASIYIEDLEAHQAAHIGDKSQYNAKSLMKVPLVMNLYRASELRRINLDAPVTIKSEYLDNAFGDLWRKGAGYQLSLRQASQLALQKSDNTAIRLINAHAGPVLQPEEKATNALRIPLDVEGDGDALITTKDYATILRCLYAACYLSQADSDELLAAMKRSEFKAPSQMLPANTPVAHKIGNVNDPEDIDDNYIGYNDCGIVYGPKKDFIFCIMLAVPPPQADEAISKIVKTAYDFLEK